MSILNILASQVSLFFETGRTSPEKFIADLGDAGIEFREPSSLGCGDAAALAQSIQASTSSTMLSVVGTDHTFKTTSIRKLDGKRWLNDELIIACLHLSDKLPFVKVGFSVPLDQRTRPKKGYPGPFQRTSNQLKAWHKEIAADSCIVCFFPLWQRENHFSLLEINEFDGCVYHYDSMNKGDNELVKVCALFDSKAWS